MRASIISIGDELIIGQHVDTNTAWLAERLCSLGCVCIEHRTVGDDRDAVRSAIADLAQHSDVLITTGGLGPTLDDLTRQALGDVLTPGEALVMDDDAAQTLRAWFKGRTESMPESNFLQAHRPRTMHMIRNPNGTAPGLAGQAGTCMIFALPGPPREMMPMFETAVVPALSKIRSTPIVTESVHAIGIGESRAAELLGDLMERSRAILVGTTASDGVITARIRSQANLPQSEAKEKVNGVAEQIERAWRPFAFSRSGAPLAQVIGNLLLGQQAKVAVAESCTGGWLGKMIVDAPGASSWFAGGWITYANELKASQLGVDMNMIQDHGAVSECVARAMAEGALSRSSAHYAVSITGVAGPDDAGPAKPAGTVFIAVAQLSGTSRVHQFRFRGDRQSVRLRSCQAALQLLRFTILDLPSFPIMLWECPSIDADMMKP